MNEIVERHAPPAAGYSLAPRNFEEAMRLAEMLASSEMVPKDFRGKPANCLIAVQWGHEVGLKPMQALQNIAVINGRPSMWGDAVLALVRASPLCEYVLETMDLSGTAICQAKRRGEPEQVRTFSDADATTAGLKGKEGPWRTAPKRMKQMRARAFALRDVFTDVLKGIAIAEEMMDLADATPQPGKAPDIVEIPDGLLDAAQEAADSGRAGFATFWKTTSPPHRSFLRHELEALKARVEQADRIQAAAAAAAAAGPVAADSSAPTAAADGHGAADSFVADMERAEREAGGGAPDDMAPHAKGARGAKR